MFRQYGFPPTGPSANFHSSDCQARESRRGRNGCPNSSKCWLPNGRVRTGASWSHRRLPFRHLYSAGMISSKSSDDGARNGAAPVAASSSTRGKLS